MIETTKLPTVQEGLKFNQTELQELEQLRLKPPSTGTILSPKVSPSVRVVLGDETFTGTDKISITKISSTPVVKITGTPNPDNLEGTNKNDEILGLEGNDRIVGFFGNDNLNGGEGDDELRGGLNNDILEGGTGNDTLIGVDTSILPIPGLGFGKGEIDKLIGGQGNDTFALGTQAVDGRDFPFYDDGNSNSSGIEDYALIYDFGLFGNNQNLGFDKIQLAGLRSNYTLGNTPKGTPSGTGIYYIDGASGWQELIGIVQNVGLDKLSLNNTSQFTFV
jgi:Ca2+-binding RTX toxin-like protein